MPRCARCGCPNEKTHPDPLGLGLCTEHTQQFRNGTIGKNHNPRQKQHPTQQAHTILNTITTPNESLRTMATRTGLTKDAIHQIKHQKWTHVRSHVWETLQDAQADYTYTHNQQPNQLKDTP